MDDQCGVFCYKLCKPALLNTVELRQQIEEYKEKYHDVGEKMKTMQQNATRQENVINYQTDQIAKLNLKLDKYEETNRQKDREINILIEINDKYKIENEKKDIIIKSLKSNIEEINIKNKVEYDDIDRKITKLQSELKDKNNLLESSQNTITLLTNQSEISAREVNEKSSEITSLRSDLESRDAVISEYREKEGKSSAESCLAFGNSNHLHIIKIPEAAPFVAPCDSSIAGTGWMVIQRRIDGSVDFNRTWQEYKQGFGDVSGEFWLGLEILHKLTTSRRYELYVQVTKMTDHVLYAKHDQFEIGSEAEHYRLKSIGEHTGTAGDSLRRHEGMGFTTLDRDNDENEDHNCAEDYGGAWWHKNEPTRCVPKI